MKQKKKFDIIIPCYNSHDTIDRCIGSILYQTKVDECKVTLVNDAGKNYTEVINRYKNCLDIQELRYDKNQGPGYARAHGLQHTKYEYIMFIDADDIFASPFTFQTLGDCFIEDPTIVMVISSILEETMTGKPIEYKRNRNFMHGKMYKRKFLEENNVYGNINSSICEDMAFNYLCLNLIDDKNTKVKAIPFVSYYWMCNLNSLGRKNHIEWEYSKVPVGCVDNFIWVFKELEKRNVFNSKVMLEIIRSMIHCWLMWLKVQKVAPQYTEIVYKQMKRFYNTIYKHSESLITDDILISVLRVYQLSTESLKDYKEILSILGE